MLGIIPEQHPERTRLFMQWKQMDWPILVDPYNLLAATRVPITVFIDEWGIIRKIGPQMDEVEDFLDQTYLPSSQSPPELPDLSQLENGTGQDTAESWRAYASALGLWGEGAQIDSAIAAYQRAIQIEPEAGPTHFHLGVTYRKRYDSDQRQPEDFRRAVEHWGKAWILIPTSTSGVVEFNSMDPAWTSPIPSMTG